MSVLKRGERVEIAFLTLAVLLGLIQAWAYRFSIYMPDAVSYLDLADGFRQADWNSAITAYWSPLYPSLISTIFFALRPTPYWEFAALKTANFLAYLLLLVSWRFLFREQINSMSMSGSSKQGLALMPALPFQITGYAIFFWAFLCLGGVYQDTPDILSAAFLFFATGLAIRLRSSAPSDRNALLLGLSLGLGYLAKAIVLPLSFVYILLAMQSAQRPQERLRRLFLVGLPLAIIAGSWIAALSLKYGHFTIGSPAALAYSCGVCGKFNILPAHGQSFNRAELKHPIRIIASDPDCYEFATPVGGTYPPWQDPAYWYEGLTVKFDPCASLVTLLLDLLAYFNLYFKYLIAGWAAMVALSRRNGFSQAGLQDNAVLLAPAAAGFCLYALSINIVVWPWTDRYFPAYIVLLYLGLLSSMRLPDELKSRRALLAMLLVVSSICTFHTVSRIYADVSRIAGQEDHTDWIIAQALKQAGVSAGTAIGRIGRMESLAWARLAKVHVVAEVEDANQFWREDMTTQTRIIQLMKEKGAQAIVFIPEPLTEQSREFEIDMQRKADDLSRLCGRPFSFHPAKVVKYPIDLNARGWQKLPGLQFYLYQH